MFANFKKEMDKMGKKIKALEKEKRQALVEKSKRDKEILQLSIDKQEAGAVHKVRVHARNTHAARTDATNKH